MYGLIGKLVSIPNRRDDLIRVLQESTETMPGCISYVIAEDAADETIIWVTEIWESVAAHHASLSLPSVRESITKARPLIASFAKVAVTNPVAGVKATTK